MSGVVDPRPGRALKSFDAVVVVPGLMGSELRDRDGKLLWGFEPRALAQAYRGDLLERLKVTDADLAGTQGIRATGLLRYPTILGWFLGSESYDRLVKAITKFTVDSRAIEGFPYDWRLPVTSNGEKLGDFALDLWQRWLKVVTTERLAEPSEVGITIVAHSMGGLLARAAQLSKLDGTPTQILTLGTPYYGSVKAVRLFADGLGGPFPGLGAKVRDFARTSPGIYDLLPRYKCVVSGSELRRLTSADVAAMGADLHLANAAQERWAALEWDSGPGAVIWHSTAGVRQPTLQALTLEAAVKYHRHLLDVDYGGDGTVYRRSAGPGWPHHSVMTAAQTHGALVATDRLVDFIRDKLTGQDVRPPLGTSNVSVKFPEAVVPMKPLTLRAARYPIGSDMPSGSRGLQVSSKDLSTNQTYTWMGGKIDDDGWLTVAHPGLPPGLHRLSVQGAGADPVRELVWIAPREI